MSDIGKRDGRKLAMYGKIPCEFPERLRIVCVHAAFTGKYFCAGKNSLFFSLRREFAAIESWGRRSFVGSRNLGRHLLPSFRSHRPSHTRSVVRHAVASAGVEQDHAAVTVHARA